MAEMIVAFQGEHGAYSEQAIRQQFESATALPCRTFSDIFASVQDGRAAIGMLPVENSLAGTVIPAYDLLIDHDLRVQAEVVLRVEHCLMTLPGTTLDQIKRVKSHHQALAQCDQTLKRMGLEPIDYFDTAGAARDLAASLETEPEAETAVIASELAAQTYGLDILARNVEDLDFNYTRFFVLGRDNPARQDPSKTSIIFTTRHVPGALYAVMRELAERDINLTKIESRPRRNRPWHYRFYMDFEGHENDPHIQAALLGILKKASFLKVLGSYPAAQMPE